MYAILRNLGYLIAPVAAVVLLALVAGITGVQGAPTLTTDKADYFSGDTAHISGGGYAPGVYALPVMRPDGSVVKGDGSFTLGWDTVTADAEGNLTYDYKLDGIVGVYEARVYPPDWSEDWSQAPIASVRFTDADIDFKQCQNDNAAGGRNDGIRDPCEWGTGGINQINSKYTEGDAVPQRLFHRIGTAGRHVMRFEYEFSKADKYAYDFLTNVDGTQSGALLNACGQLQGWVSLSTCTALFSGAFDAAIPPDTFDAVASRENPPGLGARNILVGGVTSASVTFPPLNGLDDPGEAHDPDTDPDCFQNCGDSKVLIDVTFTTGADNQIVGLWFAGHLAEAADPPGPAIGWGPGFGASSISGSPFHVSYLTLDGGSVGKRDNQLQSGAVIPPGQITVCKETNPDGSTQSFEFDPSYAPNFFLTDGLCNDSGSLLPGTYSVGEVNIPAGWELESVVCSSSIGDTETNTTIELDPGETVTCTFEDTKGGHIIVEKQTIPDGSAQSFEFDPSWSTTNFHLSDGDQNDSGALQPGTYSVGEVNIPAGWELESVVCSSSIGDTETNTAIELDPGETVTCIFNDKLTAQDLTVTKTATPSFTRTWEWTITKDYDATYYLFAGGSVTHNYRVSVTPSSRDSDWQVVGKITVINPNDWEDIVADVTDAVDNGGTCVVTGGSNVTVPKGGGSVVLDYTCTYSSTPTPSSGVNTATASWDKNTYGTPSGSASGGEDFAFGDPTTEVNPVITVDDDNLIGETWSADRAAASWEYNKDFACSSNPADYTDGTYSYHLRNTATIVETGGKDPADVVVDCYAPVVTKTAAGTYDERHEWDVEKTVDPASQDAFAGDTASFDWTVVVTESVFEENFRVAGSITVVNPDPSAAMTVSLADALDDSTVATIGPCTGGDLVGSDLTVPAGGTATCDYAATPSGRTATLNTASATLDGLTATATASVGWTANVIRGSATLTDDLGPLNEVLTDGDTFDYGTDYTCSSDSEDYTDGAYSHTVSNTAIVTSGDERDRDTASTAVNCYYPAKAKVVKVTVEGPSDIGQFPFTFELYNPAGTKVETKTLNAAGEVTFDTELRAEGTWTVKEILPTGWVSTDDSLECTFAAKYWDDAGKTFTCTFHNTEKGRVIVNKVCNLTSDPQQFPFTASYDADGFNLGCGGSNNSGDLDPGSYLVSETVPAGWELTSATCDDGSDPSDIGLSAGETVTCTFRNTKEAIFFTDTQWCPFDFDPNTPGSQFRKIFTPDPQNHPYYKLNASNPGQFYDNVFLGGTPGGQEELTITVPYPWVTQGANAIQVHDTYTTTTINGKPCFVPGPDISSQFTISTNDENPVGQQNVSSSGRPIILLNDYDYDRHYGETTLVTVEGKIPATGLIYVTIHLDYGLKGTGGYSKSTNNASCAPPDPAGDDIDAVASGTGSNPGLHNICDGQDYTFSFTDGDNGSVTVSQRNAFKKNPGIGGTALKADTAPVQNTRADIYNSSGKKVSTVYTDEDGWYMWSYKYTGKPTTFTVKLPAYNLSKTVQVKSNGYAQADFVVP